MKKLNKKINKVIKKEIKAIDKKIAKLKALRADLRAELREPVGESRDDKFLQYIADYYREHGRVPGVRNIMKHFSVSPNKIADFYKRYAHYFIKENGKKTRAKKAFLKAYGLKKL